MINKHDFDPLYRILKRGIVIFVILVLRPNKLEVLDLRTALPRQSVVSHSGDFLTPFFWTRNSVFCETQLKQYFTMSHSCSKLSIPRVISAMIITEQLMRRINVQIDSFHFAVLAQR